jgi:hypothetical protein
MTNEINTWQHIHVAAELPLGGAIIIEATPLRDFVPEAERNLKQLTLFQDIPGDFVPLNNGEF